MLILVPNGARAIDPGIREAVRKIQQAHMRTDAVRTLAQHLALELRETIRALYRVAAKSKTGAGRDEVDQLEAHRARIRLFASEMARESGQRPERSSARIRGERVLRHLASIDEALTAIIDEWDPGERTSSALMLARRIEMGDPHREARRMRDRQPMLRSGPARDHVAPAERLELREMMKRRRAERATRGVERSR